MTVKKEEIGRKSSIGMVYLKERLSLILILIKGDDGEQEPTTAIGALS